uniref:Uncharacterized protein n=1 Tax=Anopheles coluzzii TaxID=1518534 RepID=A0A8W7Q3K4_ANOCL
MPPFVLSTLLLCRWSEDSLSDFGDRRNRSARGMVVALCAFVSAPIEAWGMSAGGLFGPAGPPDASPPYELLTVAVSSAAGALPYRRVRPGVLHATFTLLETVLTEACTVVPVLLLQVLMPAR